ncbi:MAG: hypothetical protein H3C35_09015 [Bacteroidetes bacterium]|nr:hypothetical protein [Bacteroidota bacterium]
MIRNTAWYLFLLLFFGCASQPDFKHICQNKVSPAVITFLESSAPESGRKIAVTVTVTDSTGLSEEFSELSFPFQFVGLGECSKETITRLCKKNVVRYIDVVKKRFPSSIKHQESK